MFTSVPLLAVMLKDQVEQPMRRPRPLRVDEPAHPDCLDGLEQCREEVLVILKGRRRIVALGPDLEEFVRALRIIDLVFAWNPNDVVNEIPIGGRHLGLGLSEEEKHPVLFSVIPPGVKETSVNLCGAIL